MSYVDTKTKKGEKQAVIRCDHTGCKNRFEGKTHTEVWKKAKAAGWLLPNASTAYCGTHRAEHGGRAPKEKSAKKTVKSGKKSAVRGKKDATGRVVSYNLNNAE